MKINRVADEKIAPSWAFDLDKKEFAHFTEADSERLMGTPESLTEDDLISQRDIIEKCASDGGFYFYNVNWDKKSIADLKEYATACGLDSLKFKETHPEYVEGIEVVRVEAQNAKMSKNASSENTLVLEDPFHLENVEEDRSTNPNREDWETVTSQKHLGKRPSDMSGAVKPLRGGEDYMINQFTQTARGQNTIGNPDAIKQYAEEGEDTGERLRRENEERSTKHQRDHAEWEQEKVASQEFEDKLRGTVFPTEVMAAQSGIRDDFDITKQNLPEETEGEKLAASREARRQSIQREIPENNWESMKTASVRCISDTFTDELKKALNK